MHLAILEGKIYLICPAAPVSLVFLINVDVNLCARFFPRVGVCLQMGFFHLNLCLI